MIHHGDSLEVLKGFPDNYFDAFITDPPYGMDYQSNRSEKKKAKIANDRKPFIWFLYDAYRTCKNGGSILSFTDWKNQEAWRFAIELAGFTVRSQVIWNRIGHGMGDLKSSFGPQHDVIWFATKGKFTFPGKRPKSVLSAMRINGTTLIHPNEKPVKLMEELIEAVTPENGLVCDPFVGSGATAAAALNTGRRFVGIELSKEYVEIARRRGGFDASA